MAQEDHVESQLLLAAMQGVVEELNSFTVQLEIIAQIAETTCDECGEGFMLCQVAHATYHDGKWYHSACYSTPSEQEE